jgi:hypothetical protein
MRIVCLIIGSLSQIGTLKVPLVCKVYLLLSAAVGSMMAISGIQMLINYIQLRIAS